MMEPKNYKRSVFRGGHSLIVLKVNPGRVLRQATEAHRPVLLTRRSRGVAVVQPVADFERRGSQSGIGP